MDEISQIAANVAEAIEQADDAEEVQLIGDTVTDVRFDVSLDGTVREITVKFNSRNTTVAVDLYSPALTVYAGWGDRHRTHIRDDKAEAVIAQARDYWEMHAPEGVEV